MPSRLAAITLLTFSTAALADDTPHTDDSHADDSHADDSHADDSHADDSHADDSHAEAHHGVIHHGEFYDSAMTLPKGDFALHPLFYPSILGVTDSLDLKFGILGLIAGPDVRVEYGFWRSGDIAMSIEPFASTDWSMDFIMAGAALRYSHMMGHNALNFTIAGEYEQDTLEHTTTIDGETHNESETHSVVEVPVELGFDIGAGDRTYWKLEAVVHPLSFAEEDGYGLLGANWNHAFGEHYRMTLGIDFIYADFVESGFEAVDDELPDIVVFPFPRFAMWWVI